MPRSTYESTRVRVLAQTVVQTRTRVYPLTRALRQATQPVNPTTYEYDALNRLTKAKIGEQTATYSYFPNGLRATKTVNGNKTQYVYLNGQVVEE